LSWIIVGVLMFAGACTRSNGNAEPESTGGSGGAGGDGGGEGGAYTDPIEACLAAKTPDDCAAVVLTPLEDCDDCGQACVWVNTHEVEVASASDSCNYGDSTSACRLVQFGEESPGDLVLHCRSFGNHAIGTTFFQETGGQVTVAYLEQGSLEGFQPCSSGTPAECDCFCKEGYPDAECIEVEQVPRSGIASGLVECPGVPIHRDREVLCTENVGACESTSDCNVGEVCICAHSGG